MQPSLPIKDIHLPDAVSAWPPAIGWWLLLGLLLLLIGAYFLTKKLQENRQLKKNIIQEFSYIKTQFSENENAVECARSLSVLMRRICLHYLDRQSTASLTGKEWLQTLDLLHHSSAFSSDIGRVLINAPYQSQASYDTDALLNLCEQCIHLLPDSNNKLPIKSLVEQG